MSLTVLRLGIDTLEASIGGDLREHVVPVLADWKARAMDADAPLHTPIGEYDFAIQPQGQKPFAYKLAGDDASICLSPSAKVPGASVRLSALGLAYWDPASLFGLMREIVEGCFGPAEPPKLSRIDVAADFQGFDPSGNHGARFVCPATFRPVYPNAEHPETFQFGKAKLVVRVYNKTRELRVSRKDWLPALWALHPGFNPASDVWRFEIQLRREAIREFGDPSPFDACEFPEAFLRYGLGWADLRIPEGKSSDRWERHPAWEALAEAAASHTTLTREAVNPSLASLPHIARSVAGYLVSAGAVAGAATLDESWGILEPYVRRCFETEDDFGDRALKRRIERLGKGDAA